MLCYITLFFIFVPYMVNGIVTGEPLIPENSNRIVTIPDGQIAGTLQTSAHNKSFLAYFQIPYALPPVGPLRFKEPLPPIQWKGILNNTEDTKICIQSGKTRQRESEDCLYVNVYTPVPPEDTNRKLSVVVWIHGGSFREGSGAIDYYGPQFFMDYDIVVVGINYRLGPFGFLSTGDGVIPANLGIKDQLQAVKWVKQNIKYFGGNPEEITIMGQSAGAASVGYLLLAEQSKGLFRAAIMHSGTPLTCWSLQKRPKSAAYQLASALDPNFSTKNSSQELLGLLMRSPAYKIKEHAMIMPPTEEANCYPGFFIPFTPIEEPESDKNAIVKGPAHDKLKNGIFNRVPTLIGINSQELLLFDVSGFGKLAALFDEYPSLIPNNNLNMLPQNRPPSGLEIKQLYTSGNFSSDLAYAINFGSDSVFTTPVARHAYLQAQYTDVYFYEFSYKGKIGELLVNKTIAGAEGVGHEEELQYIFQTEENWDENKFPASDILTRRRLLQLWSDFIKTTNPTPKKLDELVHITWPKVSQDSFAYVNINNSLTVETKPKRYVEWSQIYNKYVSEPLDTY